MRGVQCGRSFFTRPKNPVDLGDLYELWNGIFQSAILGSVPYVNVDIAHKAFPMRNTVVNVIKWFGLQGRDRREPDRNRALDRDTEQKLATYLRGLQISYELRGNPASKKLYKFTSLETSANNYRFSNEGKEVTIQQYFNQKYRYPIEYPHWPCIKVGNNIRSLVFPAELCTVIGDQVSLYHFILLT